MFEKLGGRKFVLGMVCLGLGTIIDLYTQRGLSENLLYLMVGLLGVFTTGNVVTKFGNTTVDPVAPAPIADLSHIEAAIGALDQRLNTADESVVELLSSIRQGIENNQKLTAAIVKSLAAGSN